MVLYKFCYQCAHCKVACIYKKTKPNELTGYYLNDVIPFHGRKGGDIDLSVLIQSTFLRFLEKCFCLYSIYFVWSFFKLLENILEWGNFYPGCDCTLVIPNPVKVKVAIVIAQISFKNTTYL